MADKILTDKDIEDFFNKNSKPSKGFFTCANCGKKVSLDVPGSSHRNHCPFCLYSLHVDEKVGDRKSKCGGLMQPIGKFLRPNGEEVIIHKCLNCGKFANNRVLGDDDLEAVADLFIIDEKDKEEWN